MSGSIDIYTLLAALACLIAGAVFAWLLYGRSSQLDKGMRYSLFAARSIVIAAITFLLFAPLIRRVSYQLDKPVIVIGQDNSLSAGTIFPYGFSRENYEKDLKSLADKLSGEYEVRVYNFSDSVNKGFDFANKGKISNASHFINQINDELLNRNVGAIILATDGIFNRGGNPLSELQKLKAPVYTIALGDTVPRKDLLIANVNYNNLAYLGNEFAIDIQAQAFESKGVQSQLAILENGKKVHEESVLISSNPYAKAISVKLKASKLGVQKYSIQLRPVEGEVSKQNNVQDIYIEVIDAKHKVLIAGASPHPDISTLKQIISSNKNYDVQVALADQLNSINPKDFGLIILYQIPNVHPNAKGWLSRLAQSEASLWYVIGAQSDLSAFNAAQQSIAYASNTNNLQEAFSYIDPNFNAFVLEPAVADELERFDPLLSPFGKIKVNASASVVLNQRIGKVRTGSPQLLLTNDSGRKTAYLIGEGIWRWKLAEAKEENNARVTTQLVLGVVQYLSVKDDRRKFKAYTMKNTFEENENIIINATLYNDSYELINSPDVSLELKGGSGKVYKYVFSRTDAAYQLETGSLPPGEYSYTAKAAIGNKLQESKGTFYVNALIAEYQQTIANHQLLNTISVQSAGKMYMPSDLNKILNDVRGNDEIKTVSYEQRRYDELINLRWLFVLFMVLLGGEWFLRKRNGEI